MSLEIKQIKYNEISSENLSKIETLLKKFNKIQINSIEISQNSSFLEQRLNFIYQNNHFIKNDSKIIDIYANINNEKKHKIYTLWILPDFQYLIEYKIYANWVVFKYGDLLGFYKTGFKDAKIYKNTNFIEFSLKSILISINDENSCFTIMQNIQKQWFLIYFPIMKIWQITENIGDFTNDGYEFVEMKNEKNKFLIINKKNELILINLENIQKMPKSIQIPNDSHLLKIENNIFLIENTNKINEILINPNISHKSNSISIFEEKKSKKYYVLSQLMKNFDSPSENFLKIPTKSILNLSEILKNGLSQIEFEFLLQNTKNSHILDSLYEFLLCEMQNLSKQNSEKFSVNSYENIFITSLTNQNINNEKLDLISLAIRIFQYKNEFNKITELYIQIYENLRFKQNFYLSNSLANRFLRDFPFIKNSVPETLELLPISNMPSHRKISGKILPEFISYLKGLYMAKCFLLYENEAFLEICEIILEIPTREMRMQILKKFAKEISGKANEFQKHLFIKILYNHGITNKDFI